MGEVLLQRSLFPVYLVLLGMLLIALIWDNSRNPPPKDGPADGSLRGGTAPPVQRGE
jgi:hypothetical protein